MTEKIKTGLIGCGKIGLTHATALSKIQECEFAAVCDPSPDRVAAFSQQFHVNGFNRLEDMLASQALQAVVVCTPHPLHASLAVQSARAGANILVEKPMAVTLKECDEMISAARSAGVKLGVVSQRRLVSPVQRVKSAIEDGKIGRPVLATVVVLGWRDEAYYQSDPWRGTWADEGGGVLVNQTPHQLDLLQWFMGPVDELFGYWENLNHPYIEVEDTAIAAIRFKNGGLGSIVVSNSQNPGLFARVHVHGENGYSIGVQTDGGSMFIAGMTAVQDPPVNDIWTVPGEDQELSAWQAEDREIYNRIDPATYYHFLQDQDFIRSILENRPPLVSGEEGRKVVEISTAIYRSQRDRSPVKFPLPVDAGSQDFDGRLVQYGSHKART